MAHRWLPAFEPQQAEPDDNRKALAVHIGLLPTGSLGSLLFFSGNRWDTPNHRTGNVDHTAWFDYATRTTTLPGSPQGSGGLSPNNYLDLFCCGHALLPDGRLLVAGGTSAMTIDSTNPHNGHWGGLREAFIFDPAATPPWQTASPMNFSPVTGYTNKGGGRWYPSLVTLADGSVLAMCGHPRVFPPSADEADQKAYPTTFDDPRHNNNAPDRFALSGGPGGVWTQLNKDGLGEGYLPDYAIFYPRLHVLPSGRLLIVQPLYTNPAAGSQDASGQYAHKSLVYDPDTQAIVASFTGPQEVDPYYAITDTRAQFTTSVLLPLTPANGYQPQVLVCGGVQALTATVVTGSEFAAVWTPTTARPAFFRAGASTVVPHRWHALATLLPTGDVLVTGGIYDWEDSPPGYDATFGVRVPEIYHVATGTWSALTDTPATVIRGYHSVALLMPDGRVLTAGSERDNIMGAGNAEFRMEIFEPDYVAEPYRMTITHHPAAVAYGEDFRLTYRADVASAYPDVAAVAIIRYGGATTHSTMTSAMSRWISASLVRAHCA